MPIFLVKATNASHGDPVKDLRGCYKRGDIVQAMDDSAFGREDPPGSGTYIVDDVYLAENPISDQFVMVKVTGITLQRALDFMAPDIDPLDPEVIVLRRRYRIRVDDIPLAIRQELQQKRFVQVTATQIRDYVRNKRTGTDGID